MRKREFLKTMALAGLSLPMVKTWAFSHSHSIPTGDNDEEYWKALRNAYLLNKNYINLENGYYSILPQPSLRSYISLIEKLNLQGSHYMRNNLAEDKEFVRTMMADFLGCSSQEIVITRNTTESLDTIISGKDWKSGDEAVMAEQDYGSMLDMFRQQSLRYGMKNILVSIPLHPISDEQIVDLYEAAITPRTRLLMVCHMINISGQILPVKKICDMAHKHGVEVMVDGAHSLAHLNFNITDLGCDYFGSSLHKWLGVPLGAGLLYMKKENIQGIWPLYADSGFATDDIRKLNHTGTHPMPTEMAIESAIRFHNAIGSERKQNRLRFLQQYWTNKVRDIPGIVLNTPKDPARSCGIANVWIPKYTPAQMQKTLMEKYSIWTVAIDSAGIKGCRITPGLFTNTTDLDALVEALRKMNGM